LATLLDREMVLIISWARKLPAFSKFSLADQMALLHATWLELLNIRIAYRSALH
ncbi:hypothetical protein HELRODRAFT_138383, partial [Helobdella robusta]|uniref:NR LBD domain-containing protein n=1 Tax=Helobdella robusta TaxID=6412 RepID=T1EIU7_HELRO